MFVHNPTTSVLCPLTAVTAVEALVGAPSAGHDMEQMRHMLDSFLMLLEQDDSKNIVIAAAGVKSHVRFRATGTMMAAPRTVTLPPYSIGCQVGYFEAKNLPRYGAIECLNAWTLGEPPRA